MHAIVATALSYAHPDGTPVFDRCSFTLPQRRYGVVGANGSGKTTLLRLIHRELIPSAGSIAVSGSTEYLEQLEAPESPCSAGERMRERLAIAFDANAGWLLLDEPSNHLDAAGRKRLYHWMGRWGGGTIVASHDRRLLQLVDAIVEIRDGGIRTFEGNYGDYVAQREAEANRIEAEIRNAQAQVKRERAEALADRERSDQRARSGKARAQAANLPKVLRGALARKAQNSAARSAAVHATRLDDARTRLDAARERAGRAQELSFDLPATSVPSGRYCYRMAGNAIAEIVGPERIGLCGDNGTGKTTLLQTIETHALVPVAHLDQRLAMLPSTGTVADAMREAAPHETEHGRRVHLGRLGFEQERTELSVAHLSGGERMRAALALLFAREHPPQLLLLDEPEAHLDLVSLEELTAALHGYLGALVVVSHDEALLEELRLDRVVTLRR